MPSKNEDPRWTALEIVRSAIFTLNVGRWTFALALLFTLWQNWNGNWPVSVGFAFGSIGVYLCWVSDKMIHKVEKGELW